MCRVAQAQLLVETGCRMTPTLETLKAMIEEYQGIPMTEDELKRALPEIEIYVRGAEQLRALDLAAVVSGRLVRVQEGQ